MRLRLRTSSLLLVLFFSLTRCSKSGSSEKDNTAPTIALTSPTAGQIFNSGQTISISGNITDNAKLVEVHIHITNKTTGKLLVDIHRYPGASNYALDETYIAEVGIQYNIRILAKDNSGNEGNATVDVSSN